MRRMKWRLETKRTDFSARLLIPGVAEVQRRSCGHDRTMTEPAGNGTKRLYRAREGRVIAGVCAGLAGYFRVDPTLVRLAFVVVTFFGGIGILCYLGAWIVIPEEGDGSSIAEDFVNKQRRNRDNGPWT
jgi:phage shock protein PspC (stress-responsive transcriptional regulator)